ncbi:MAG: ADP-forming succinate--CoA ligase subunit beta [Clostridia bacterium]|nr:ADP-forming succinate--CoA ligase subunit beta [Clostridia bacterium]
MKLYEYMAKAVLREAGLPVPPGRLCRTPAEAEAACRELGPVAVKAQVLVGGRGKAGGIRLADDPAAAREAAAAILGMDLKGYTVEQVYCESRLSIEKELYVGIAVDAQGKRPVVITSASGGMDIEDVPEKAIVRMPVALPWGLMGFQARELARRVGLAGELASQYAGVVEKLWQVFRAKDAELVEVNPLAVVEGRLVCADARLNVDDDALFRHPELPRVSEATELESRVRELGLAFVQLDGDIAVMANGAGITMGTLDVIQHFGGRPMNFLDAGGGSAAGPTAKALEILVQTRPKAILINIFGGITRCDEVAKAIVEVKRRVGIPMPLVVRLVGTNEEAGRAMLEAEGVQAFRTMEEAARRVVELAGEGRGA